MSEGNTRDAAAPTVNPPTARARFCACEYEQIKPGAYVYLRRRIMETDPSLLTVNADEADARHPQSVVNITGAAFVLNERGEALLKGLE